MAKVVLTSQLARWLDASATPRVGELTLEVAPGSVREVLERVFDAHPTLRGYVVDEHGTVRHHVAIFVDGQPVKGKAALQEPVPARGEVYIMQALSGG
jgi:sulfur carrier protein ThiS